MNYDDDVNNNHVAIVKRNQQNLPIWLDRREQLNDVKEMLLIATHQQKCFKYSIVDWLDDWS